MSEFSYTISAFGDEIAEPLEEQCRVMRELKIDHLELRAAWGKNVLHLDDDDVARVQRVCAEYDMSISSLGSPIGKSPIMDPIEKEIANLERICQIGEALGTRNVRIFSFYPPDISTNAHYDEYVELSITRLMKLAEVAEKHGLTLMLENEKAIVGDTLDRCYKIVSAISSPHLRFLWDPANFVQVGEAHPTDDGWAMLGETIGYVHIKDCVLSDGGVRPAGEGDGQIRELLTKLRESGYQGFLSLEPHLAIAGHSSGFTGPEGMAVAAGALRRLLEEIGE